MTNLLQNLRYALRRLRKSPSFTVAAVLTLALAIGANTVVFSVMNGLILRPLNVPQAQSLYSIGRASDKETNQSYPDYLDLRDRNHSFDGLAAYSVPQVALNTGEGPSPTWGVEASGNYFDALRIRPYLGRFFHSSDEHGRNSAPYIVLSSDRDLRSSRYKSEARSATYQPVLPEQLRARVSSPDCSSPQICPRGINQSD